MEQAEVEKLVGELEIAVDRLRSLYEQYFMGIEKLEPTVPRKDVDRRIHVLRKEQVRNTALRFRFQMIIQRYNTYQTHWQRICREIENGTYKRHLARAQKRFGDDARLLAAARVARAAPGAPVLDGATAAELAELDREFAADDGIEELDVELEEEETPLAPRVAPARAPAPAPASPAAPRPARAGASAPPAGPRWRKAAPSPARSPEPAPSPAAERAPAPAPARPAPPAPASPAPPASPAVRSPFAAARAPAPAAPRASTPAPAPARRDDLPEERLRQLYSQYVDAKRRHNESTAAITYEGVAKSLRESSAKLREKHGKAVDFEVSVKDGKTILKPVLK